MFLSALLLNFLKVLRSARELHVFLMNYKEVHANVFHHLTSNSVMIELINYHLSSHQSNDLKKFLELSYYFKLFLGDNSSIKHTGHLKLKIKLQEM